MPGCTAGDERTNVVHFSRNPLDRRLRCGNHPGSAQQEVLRPESDRRPNMAHTPGQQSTNQDVDPRNPGNGTQFPTVCVLFVVVLAAYYVPVRRAIRVDTVVALKHE